MTSLGKIYVASVTAFNERNQLDSLEQEKLFERNIQEGADGFFIGGSSAEFSLLSFEERIASLELASQYAPRTELIAHIGDLGTEAAIAYAQEAKRLGYTKISAVPPIYFGYSPSEIFGYFEEIANAVELPVIYYNIPMNTHVEIDLTNPEWQAFLESGVVSGIKHTEHNLFLAERIHEINRSIQIYGGLEQNMLGFKGMGIQSFIGSTFNFMLPHYREIDRLFEAGENESALLLQNKANNIMSTIWESGLFPSIKYILSCQGNKVGAARKPFKELDQQTKNRIDDSLMKNLFKGEQ